jgi:2-methylcitrate dehydratase PrpD
VAAGVILTHACWTDLFDEFHRRDPVIDRFAREKVSVSCNPRLLDGAVKVTLATLSDEYVLECDVPPGDPRRPMTAEQMFEKNRRCIAGSTLEVRDFDVNRLLKVDKESSLASLLADLRSS